MNEQVAAGNANPPKKVANQGTESKITSLQNFCRNAGISPVTAWRMRRKGWLKTVNICGRQYVTDESASEFVRRAESGEFAKSHPTPKRKEAA